MIRTNLSKFFAAVALGLAPLAAQAAPFTAGDLIVERIGTGSGALSSAAAAVFVDEYTPLGAFVQSIAMPTAPSGANFALTDSGTGTSDGYLNLSLDGHYITVSGYNAAPGTTGLVNTSTTGGSAVVRVVGRIDAAGSVNTTTSTTSYSGNNFRSAVSSNGTDLWLSGATSGVVYTTFGASGAGTQVSTTTVNTRVVEIYASQSNPLLYASSNNGALAGINTVDSGLPTGTGNTIANIISSPSSFGFFAASLNPASLGVLDTIYIADDDGTAGGILKYSLVGSSWVSNGKIGVGTDNYRGLTGKVTGNGVQLYATRQGAAASPGIVGLLDTTGYNATIGGTPNLLVALPTNEAFRGIDFAPTAVAPEPSTLVLGAIGLGMLFVIRRGRKSFKTHN